MSVTVRAGALEDFVKIFELLRRMHEEIGFGPINGEKAAQRIAAVLEDGTALLAELDGKIVGSIGLQVSNPWYTDTGFIGDLWTYVIPQARSTRAAFLLIEAAKRLSKAQGDKKLILGFLGCSDESTFERKVKFYVRMGLKPIGVTFQYGA